MNRSFLLFILINFLSGFSFAQSQFTIVIDPGHGGKDPGAMRGKLKEKDINLGVALVLGEYIKENYKDVKVVYTRKTDVFVELDRRAEIANKAKANLFISIHTNSTAAKNTTASGADTYILGLARSEENLEVAKRENSVILLEDDYSTKYEGFDPNSAESYIIFEFMSTKYMDQSLEFASSVQDGFRTVAKRADKGVRQAGFLVLRKTSMPSALIELGFINNSAEAQYLASKAGQRAMASSIFSGFKKYKRNFDKMQSKFDAGKIQPDNEVIIAEQPKNTNKDNIKPEIQPVVTPSKGSTERQRKGKAEVIKAPENKSAKVVNANKEEYRVQFLISPKKLPVNSPQFRGLSPVDSYQDANGYKYTYGSSTDITEITRIRAQVRKKFKDAFIIVFQNGKRIR